MATSGLAFLNRRKWRWSIPLDTMTTRFLLLFILVLLIPGMSLAVFTSSRLLEHFGQSHTLALMQQAAVIQSTLRLRQQHLNWLARHQAGASTLSPLFSEKTSAEPVLLRFNRPQHGDAFSFFSATSQKQENWQLELLHEPAELETLAQSLHTSTSIPEEKLKTIPSYFLGKLLKPGSENWQLALIAPTSSCKLKHACTLLASPLNSSSFQSLTLPYDEAPLLFWIDKPPGYEHPQSLLLNQAAADLQRLPKLERENLKNSRQQALQLVEGWRKGGKESGSEGGRLSSKATPGLGHWHYPVFSTHQRWLGSFYLIQPSSQMRGSILTFYTGIYFIFLASFVFSALMAMIASRTMTVPLRNLAEVMNDLSKTVHHWGGRQAALPLLPVDHKIYELRQLGLSFSRLLEAIRQDYRLREEFVATLTHDLKVPMLAAKQTLTYMEKGAFGDLPETVAPLLLTLRRSNQFCLELVVILLEVYRYESGKQKLVFGHVNLIGLLGEALQELEPLILDKQLVCQTSWPTEKATTAFGDGVELKRVVHNILSNAVSNTPKGGTLTCSVIPAEQLPQPYIDHWTHLEQCTLSRPVDSRNKVLLLIQDSGLGMEKSVLEGLFQRFSGNKSRNPISMGLGLYHCSQVVEAHHGVIWVESTEGTGTAVLIALPTQYQSNPQEHRFYDRRKLER